MADERPVHSGGRTRRAFLSAMLDRIRWPAQQGKSAQTRLRILLGLVLAALAGLPGPAAARDRAITAIALPHQQELRIIAFGTSLTARYDWPERLGEALETCLRRPVQIAKTAAAGEGSSWALGTGLAKIAEMARQGGPPDLVIVEFAINDADLIDGVSLRRSRRQHAELLERLRAQLAPGGQILLMSTNPVSGALRHLQRPRLEAYNRIYAELAAASGVGHADLYGRWHRAMEAGLQPMLPDGVHPESQSAREIILPVLVPMIAAALGQDDCHASPTLPKPRAVTNCATGAGSHGGAGCSSNETGQMQSDGKAFDDVSPELFGDPACL